MTIMWYTLSWLWWIYITGMLLSQTWESGWEELPAIFIAWIICIIIPLLFRNPYE